MARICACTSKTERERRNESVTQETRRGKTENIKHRAWSLAVLMLPMFHCCCSISVGEKWQSIPLFLTDLSRMHVDHMRMCFCIYECVPNAFFFLSWHAFHYLLPPLVTSGNQVRMKCFFLCCLTVKCFCAQEGTWWVADGLSGADCEALLYIFTFCNDLVYMCRYLWRRNMWWMMVAVWEHLMILQKVMLCVCVTSLWPHWCYLIFFPWLPKRRT